MNTAHPLLRTLAGIVGDSQLITDAERLEPFSHDETSWLAPVLPLAAVRPGSTAEVSAVLAACSAAGVPVVPRGGGTGLSGGARPVPGAVVVSLARLDRLLALNVGDLTVDVQPGLVLGRLHEAVEERGLFYPPDAGSLEDCTLGGNVAENAGGPRALRYGVTGNFVLGLELVLVSGEVLQLGRRTIKGVSGYDLTRLVVGSEGTLGVITRITLELLPRPREVATALVTFPGTAQASRGAADLLAGGILPRTLEYLDGRCLDALRPTARFRLPAAGNSALIVETDGDDADAVLAELARAVEILENAGASATAMAQTVSQQRDLWATRRQLSDAMRRVLGRKLSEDITVPRSRIPEAVARLGEIGERHGLLTAAYGHAGDGNLHVQVLFAEAAQQAAAESALQEVVVMALGLGGTLTGEHGIGVAKLPFFTLEHGAGEVALMQRVKAAFDPRGLMNPGKAIP